MRTASQAAAGTATTVSQPYAGGYFKSMNLLTKRRGPSVGLY